MIFRSDRRRIIVDLISVVYLAEISLTDADLERLHDFEEECAATYFLEKDVQHKSSFDEQIRATTEM